MKTMTKKLGAIILALAMCFSLTCVAFADDDYSITVENSIGGVTYSAYKVFDAQYSGDAVSYTIDSASAWYDAVSNSDLFSLSQYDDTTYHVERSSTATDADIIAFLNDTYSVIADNLTASATEEGTGSAITLDLDEAGYYYVTTSTGATASITTAAPTATIVDKNQKPGEGGTDPKDPDWEGGFTKDADDTSYSIGDEISYTIKSYVPTYDGDAEIEYYTITDTMGEGLTYDNDITVKIIGTGLDDYEDITEFCEIVLDDATNVLTITWYPATIEAEAGYTYPADAVVTIEYTDTVNEAADEIDMTNSVNLAWHSVDGSDDFDPTDPSVTEYTYGFDLEKTDGTDVLSGAAFTLQKLTDVDDDSNPVYSEEISFIYDEASNTYEEWDGIATGETTTTITVADGEVNIWGLGAGTYILTETVAPDGYNLLSEPVTIVIEPTDTGWTVTVSGDNAEATTSDGTIGDSDDGHGVATMPTITIINNAGSTLPGTGGIGTTIFYIIGGALVAGAVVVLITRRRMNSAD